MWLRLLVLVGAGAAVLLASQFARRAADEKDAEQAWNQLVAGSARTPAAFDPAMVAELPEPARRFFLFAIAPGARLGTAVEITMEGELSLGTKADPKYQPMHAQQVLAAPEGMVWRLRSGTGALRVDGSDAMVADRSWTRFWLLGTVPVARAGGDRDHLRSSFGRVVAEALFWAPASLLPREGVTWSAVDPDTARVTVTHRGMRQEVDVRVDAKGQPLWVRMPRWSNANADGAFREQPFGGVVSDFRSVQGFRVPFRVDGGNFFGTPEYFPFYRARVLSLRVL
ncbi:MAG TPA: DUF6544 family protein [Ramlibacter sp.]|jgi:hypothetical protein|nr:DUF6544 family protein [Ramlibacter sp.]